MLNRVFVSAVICFSLCVFVTMSQRRFGAMVARGGLNMTLFLSPLHTTHTLAFTWITPSVNNLPVILSVFTCVRKGFEAFEVSDLNFTVLP